jgi:hypothetical protein
MYEPGVMVVDEGFFGKVLRYGARVLLRSFASPYHAPVNPKLTRDTVGGRLDVEIVPCVLEDDRRRWSREGLHFDGRDDSERR